MLRWKGSTTTQLKRTKESLLSHSKYLNKKNKRRKTKKEPNKKKILWCLGLLKESKISRMSPHLCFKPAQKPQCKVETNTRLCKNIGYILNYLMISSKNDSQESVASSGVKRRLPSKLIFGFYPPLIRCRQSAIKPRQNPKLSNCPCKESKGCNGAYNYI